MAKHWSAGPTCRQNNEIVNVGPSIRSTTSTAASPRSCTATEGSGSPRSAGGWACPRPRSPNGCAGLPTAVPSEVEPRVLGYTICAILRVSPSTRDLKLIPDVARQLPQVTECYRITGEDCYFLKLYLRSIEELEPILDRFTPLGRTTTSIVNATPVPRRPLPVSEIEPGSVTVDLG